MVEGERFHFYDYPINQLFGALHALHRRLGVLRGVAGPGRGLGMRKIRSAIWAGYKASFFARCCSLSIAAFAKHWTRAQAIAYMLEKTGIREKEVIAEQGSPSPLDRGWCNCSFPCTAHSGFSLFISSRSIIR